MPYYAPYLLYQISRFGALSIPQMLQIAEGKFCRSIVYRMLSILVEAKHVYPILNPRSLTRAYYATPEGRQEILGFNQSAAGGVRAKDLDHTLLSVQTLLELSQRSNVTGIATPFEMKPEQMEQFCQNRTPDGIFRLTQGDQSFELALEVETSVKNTSRINDVLERYSRTFAVGMLCSAVLIVAMTSTIHTMYSNAIQKLPEKIRRRIRLIKGPSIEELSVEAYGTRRTTVSQCVDLTRTQFFDEIQYTPTKTRILLSQEAPKNPQIRRARHYTRLPGVSADV